MMDPSDQAELAQCKCSRAADFHGDLRPGDANAARGGVTFAKVQAIVAERCAGCHAEKPSFPGIAAAPGGVMLDTPERIKLAAPRIGQQTVLTRAMPIGNLTKMTDEERAVIGAWFPAGAVVK